MYPRATVSIDSPQADATLGDAQVPRGLRWVIGGLLMYRILYHLTWVAEVPFAVAPVSDGRVYELAALDLLAHPPLGQAPFYLQGFYAAVLAAPMALGGLPAALLVQLLLALGALALWYRAMQSWFGARTAAIGLALALAIPALAFYENKILSASLTIDCSVAALAAIAWLRRGAPTWACAVAGLAAGACVLARPNLLLAVPALAFALWRMSRRDAPAVRLVVFATGVVLALAPMAWRNAVVTGDATIFPAHGGGTSFYIGNNAGARGVWNAGGVFSGDVTREREEIVLPDAAPGVELDAAAGTRERGRELYRRALQDIGDDPLRWVRLELRKVWLLLGNDELAQDYDVAGERELIPWAWPIGLPFALLVALALIGAWRCRGDRVLGWTLGGLAFATIAANLVFFTSSQHRLPLVVPLVTWAAPGVVALAQWWRARAVQGRARVVFASAVVVAAQGWWPRVRSRGVTAVHYYNLAVAYDRVGETQPALSAFDRALALAPDHPVMLIERASLRVALSQFDGARQDLEHLRALPSPPWVQRRAALLERQLAALP